MDDAVRPVVETAPVTRPAPAVALAPASILGISMSTDQITRSSGIRCGKSASPRPQRGGGTRRGR